jgi:hypothetical protein
LSRYYETYEQAKFPGTDVPDWDLRELLLAELMDDLSPEQRDFINDRREAEHAPEASAYFASEEVIRTSNYYGTADDVYREVFADAASQIVGRRLDTFLAFQRELRRARLEGETQLARRLESLEKRVNSRATRLKERLRRGNPDLDVALLFTGRVRRPLTREGRLALRGG